MDDGFEKFSKNGPVGFFAAYFKIGNFAPHSSSQKWDFLVKNDHFLGKKPIFAQTQGRMP